MNGQMDMHLLKFWVSRSFDLGDLGVLEKSPVNIFNDYIFEISLFHWSKCTIECAICLTLILKSAQARCELESLEMYFVHLKDLLWSYGNYNICKWYFISRCSSSFKEFRNFWLQFSKTNKPITNNEYAPFRKKGLKILPGWNFFEAESFSGLKVSQLFSGLKVSPD